MLGVFCFAGMLNAITIDQDFASDGHIGHINLTVDDNLNLKGHATIDGRDTEIKGTAEVKESTPAAKTIWVNGGIYDGWSRIGDVFGWIDVRGREFDFHLTLFLDDGTIIIIDGHGYNP